MAPWPLCLRAPQGRSVLVHLPGMEAMRVPEDEEVSDRLDSGLPRGTGTQPPIFAAMGSFWLPLPRGRQDWWLMGQRASVLLEQQRPPNVQGVSRVPITKAQTSSCTRLRYRPPGHLLMELSCLFCFVLFLPVFCKNVTEQRSRQKRKEEYRKGPTGPAREHQHPVLQAVPWPGVPRTDDLCTNSRSHPCARTRSFPRDKGLQAAWAAPPSPAGGRCGPGSAPAHPGIVSLGLLTSVLVVHLTTCLPGPLRLLGGP